MAYSLHDVKVKGIQAAKILDCQVEARYGEHSCLTILAYAKEPEELLYGIPSFQPVEVELKNGSESVLLFSGVISDVQIQAGTAAKIVRIEGKSYSWLMDLTKRSRSFQDKGMSYQALAQAVLKDYPGSSLFYTGPEQSVGSLVIQYEETDWEFLQRVLSLAGIAATPESRRAGFCLYAGIPPMPASGLSGVVQNIDKDMASYYYLKANGRPVPAAAFTRYQVTSGQPLGILERVNAGGQLLTVYACRYTFYDQELCCTFGLQRAEGLAKAAVYPMHLIGTALLGEIQKTSGSKVQVAMEIDKTSGNPALYWFPYSTISASTDGSGWYCMPEIGDSVRVYFPSKYEREAVALSAVSSYAAPAGGGEDRMQDPNSRYLKTKTGQELALAPGHMRLSCGKGKSAVTIHNSGKISIQAVSAVEAEAEEELTVHAEEELLLHAKEGIILQSLSGGAAKLEGNKAAFQGTEVKLE